jgi:hypothetical protein
MVSQPLAPQPDDPIAAESSTDRPDGIDATGDDAEPKLPGRSPEPLFKRLNPRDKVRVVSALLGLLFLGVFLVALAWILGRRARRMARKPARSSRVAADAWAQSPLHRASSADDGYRPSEDE